MVKIEEHSSVFLFWSCFCGIYLSILGHCNTLIRIHCNWVHFLLLYEIYLNFYECFCPLDTSTRIGDQVITIWHHSQITAPLWTECSSPVGGRWWQLIDWYSPPDGGKCRRLIDWYILEFELKRKCYYF